MININKKINDDTDLNTEEILRYNNYEFWFMILTFQFVKVQARPLQPLHLWRERTVLQPGSCSHCRCKSLWNVMP
jgi:hypothetical protein